MTFQEQSSEIAQGSLSEESGASVGEQNVQRYRPTPYIPEVWPVVADASRESSFQPLDYERVSESQYVVDPMFANFDLEVKARIEAESQSLEALDAGEEIGLVELSEEAIARSALEGAEDGEASLGVAEVEPFQESANNSPTDFGSDVRHNPEREQSSVVADSRAHAENTSRRPSKTAAPADIENRIEQEVQKRLAAAQDEREQMLAQVQQTAYTKALEDARAEFEASKSEYQARFETIIEDVRSQASETCRDNERQAVELAFQIAKKLLGSVVADHRDYIHEVISEALKAVGNTEITSIRVSPQDYQFLASPAGASDGSHTERTWKLESDDSIGAGCIVVTPAGDIDFDLEKSWARMREKVSRGPKS